MSSITSEDILELVNLIVSYVKKEMQNVPQDLNFINSIRVKREDNGKVQIIFEAPRYDISFYKRTGMYKYIPEKGSYASQLDKEGSVLYEYKAPNEVLYYKSGNKKRKGTYKKTKYHKVIGMDRPLFIKYKEIHAIKEINKYKINGETKHYYKKDTEYRNAHKGYASNPEMAVMKAISIWTHKHSGKIKRK